MSDDSTPDSTAGVAQPSRVLQDREITLFENFEIHQKITEIGRFEFGISRETTDFLDFPRFA